MPNSSQASTDRDIGLVDPAPVSAGDLSPLIQQILVALDDIRTQLSGMRKSHFLVEEVAKLTGRSSYTIRVWIRQGRLRAIRVPGTGPKGRLLIPREELAKLVGSGLAGNVPTAAID